MQPNNYILPQPDFSESFVKGLQMGEVMRVARLRRKEEQEAEEFKTELSTALNGSDPRAFLNLSVKYPKYGQGLKTAWEAMKQEQRSAEFNSAREVFYAINSGRPDVALSVVDRQIAAMKNAGQDPAQLQQIKEGIQRDPVRASQYVGAFMAAVAPKDYAETLKKLGEERRSDELHPIDVDQRTANVDKTRAEVPKLEAETAKVREEAKTAAVTARFAESNAVKDLERKGWDITKIQEDIKIAKLNSQIAAANVSIGREANSIRRDELKLKRDDLVQKREDEVRTKGAEVESARFNIDNTLNTIDRILKNPRLNSVVGPIEGRLPAVADDSADAIALIETLGSQAFLSQLPLIKGMGQLSNVEGDKMQKAFQNLGRVQSEKQFRESLTEAQRLYTKARRNIATKFGVPDTIPDTPAATAPAARPNAPKGAKSTDDMLKELGVLK
jgi:hypothetical protein